MKALIVISSTCQFFLLTVCAILLFAGTVNAQDDEEYNKLVVDIDAILTTFYQNPTQKNLESLSTLLQTNPEKTGMRSKAGLYSAIVIGYGSKKYNLEIKGEGPVFDAAKAIAADQKEIKLVQMLNDNSVKNRIRHDTWWYSFFATGENKYLELLFEHTDDFFDENFKGDPALTILANGNFMRYSKEHEKIAEFCKASIDEHKGTWKESLLRTCVSIAKTKPVAGKKFDRSTPEGTLRLFVLGLSANNVDRIRSTVYPMKPGEFQSLTAPWGKPNSLNMQQVVEAMKYERLKAGDTYALGSGTGGGKEMKVDPRMDSDRGVTAYLGPRSQSPAPYQIMKIYGQWWVDPEIIIHMRKASEKLLRKGS